MKEITSVKKGLPTPSPSFLYETSLLKYVSAPKQLSKQRWRCFTTYPSHKFLL